MAKRKQLVVLLFLLGPPMPLRALDKPVPPASATTDKVVKPTRDSANNTGPTSPDRVLPGEPPRRKNYWIPALEIPSFLVLLNQYDRFAYPDTVYRSGLQS